MTRNGGRPNVGGFRILSERQEQVARLVAQHKTNGEISGELGLASSHVASVVQAVRIKAGILTRDRAMLVSWCQAYIEKISSLK